MKDLSTKLFIVLLMLLTTEICNSKRNFGFKIIFLNVSGPVVKFGALNSNYYNERHKCKIDVAFKLRQNAQNFSMVKTVDILRGDKSKINLVDVVFDFCQVDDTKNRLMAVFTKELMRVSNFPRSCPLLANKLYYVKNYTLDPESFPPFTPPLNFVLRIRLIIDQTEDALILIQGKVYKL